MTARNPAANSTGCPFESPLRCAMSWNDPKLYGSSIKLGAALRKATSHIARIKAMKEVLPVLLGPTNRVSGAKGTVCWSAKQRKFSIVTLFTRLLRLDEPWAIPTTYLCRFEGPY